MPSSLPDPQSDASSPFVILLQAQDVTAGGYFRPAASVLLTPVLRTSGLLRELPGEELRTLLLVLTFVSPNGHFLPTLSQLAQGFSLSSGKMKARLERLQSFSWQGKPLLYRIERESGLHAYTPSLHLVTTEQAPMPARETSQVLPYRVAGREAVIAHSRATYTRPRAEVEREIALLNGWPLPETREPEATSKVSMSPEERTRDYLKQRLLRLGVSGEQADFLLAHYAAEEVERQIDWLPYRNAKSPAGFVVAAIEGSYGEPRVLRRSRALETIPAESSESAEPTAQPDEAATAAETPDLPAFDLRVTENLILPAPVSEEADAAGGDADSPSLPDRA
jgi:hypothetical protein